MKILALSTALLLASPVWAGPVFPSQVGEFPKPVTTVHDEANCEEMDTEFVDVAHGETLDDAQKEMAECFECVFPSEWLRGEGLDPETQKNQALAQLNSPSDPHEDPTMDALLPKVELASFGSSKAKKLGKNSMTYPVAGNTQFLAGLGVPRSGGRRHKGVDLGAKSGTPIVAAWSGRIQKAGQNGLGGWAVRMQHPNGMITYYAHMKTAPRVRTGQLVSAGANLGGVGMSGNARGTVPHLHFEVHAGRKVLNPLAYFAK